jgi:Flp pilus assembly CpaF family ATPase
MACVRAVAATALTRLWPRLRSPGEGITGAIHLSVVIPDITRTHWSVNIRKFVVRAAHLDDLVGLGTLTAHAARFLGAAVAAGLNILVAGGT